MTPVKFVHVLKRIESLDRDIAEIHMLEDDLNPDRAYSTALKISLEQQVNNLLNEKVKLMEVKIENAPDYLKSENRMLPEKKHHLKPLISFDDLEREYYETLRSKRANYNSETVKISESLAMESLSRSKKEVRPLPSLAEKSLTKPGEPVPDEQKSFIKSREDLLKNLPPLEY